MFLIEDTRFPTSHDCRWFDIHVCLKLATDNLMPSLAHISGRPSICLSCYKRFSPHGVTVTFVPRDPMFHICLYWRLHIYAFHGTKWHFMACTRLSRQTNPPFTVQGSPFTASIFLTLAQTFVVQTMRRFQDTPNSDDNNKFPTIVHLLMANIMR